MPIFYDDYNYWAFGVFTSFLLGGDNSYWVVSQDPTLLFINIWRYPPLYLLFTTPATIVRSYAGDGLLYLALIKVPFAVADVASIFYMFKILERYLSRNTSLAFSAFYAFNPVVLFESAGGGFNDPIPITFTVVSFYHFLRYVDDHATSDRHELSKSAVLLGLGIATKIYPLLLLPLFVKRLKRRWDRPLFALTAVTPGLAFSLPFLLWDFNSYVDILTFRNVGGEHPLFPGTALPGYAGWLLVGALASLLVFVYSRKSSIVAGAVMLFLWIDLAIFVQSLNYMVWGVPFFTIFAAMCNRLRLMPLLPIPTFVAAMIFQGSYNSVSGSSGLYYWTYHLTQAQVVVFREYPVLRVVGPWMLGLGMILTLFCFIVVAHGKWGNPVKLTHIRNMKSQGPRATWIRVTVLVLLCVSAMISWGLALRISSFQAHDYPSIHGSRFQFNEDLRSSLIDYQWIFEGNGSYTIDPSGGTISIESPSNGTASIRRGWLTLVDGFYPSNDAVAKFAFRFGGFSDNSANLIIANMTDGYLLIRNETIMEFVYFDELNDSGIVIAQADYEWHNFTTRYSEGERTIQMDNLTWTVPGGIFKRLILGNSSPRVGFGGTTTFSRISILIHDFPTRYQSLYASFLSVLAPIALVAVVLALTHGPFRRPRLELYP